MRRQGDGGGSAVLAEGAVELDADALASGAALETDGGGATVVALALCSLVGV